MEYQILFWIILMTFINGLMAFVGFISFILSKKTLNKILGFLVAFATGALIGGAIFHLIPEALSTLSLALTISLIIVGFILFFILEKILHWHHCHDGDCKHAFNYLILYGDSIHNFIDGLLIAGAFLVSIPLGITTSLLIILHEIPQELGNFGVLLFGGFGRKKALIYSFLAQLTSVLGGILGFFFLGLKENAVYLLPIGAGGFLYISIIDLIPEIFKERKPKKIIINIISIIIGILLLLSSRFFIG